ncbi:hypothetical protein [Zavarzinia sp.]|uniref:hypothetical protein n=1 Tax=Zavarzinia sp. TaxID=2027920 RepID=UPI003567D175
MILAWVMLVLAVGAFWGVNHFFGPDKPTEVAEPRYFGQVPLDEGGGFSERVYTRLRERCPVILRKNLASQGIRSPEKIAAYCDCMLGFMDERLRANAIASADIETAVETGEVSFALGREMQRFEQRCLH